MHTFFDRQSRHTRIRSIQTARGHVINRLAKINENTSPDEWESTWKTSQIIMIQEVQLQNKNWSVVIPQASYGHARNLGACQRIVCFSNSDEIDKLFLWLMWTRFQLYITKTLFRVVRQLKSRVALKIQDQPVQPNEEHFVLDWWIN